MLGKALGNAAGELQQIPACETRTCVSCCLIDTASKVLIAESKVQIHEVGKWQ